MAARPTWKGHLKVSLVNIPIRVFPATDSARSISFKQLHGECQHRIQQKKWCPTCETEVDKTEIVKGYEFEKGRYVVLDDDDIAKVRSESTRVINLVRFTDAASIDAAHLEKPYYLAPDDKVAADAFAVMREAMAGKPGIGKLALHGREYLVVVQPRSRGLVMYTLRHASELRRMDAIDDLDDLPTAVSPDEVALAKQVIANFEGELDLSEFHDQYQADLRVIIDAKVAGQEVVAPVDEAPPKVVNLMEALRKSLDSVGADKKRRAPWNQSRRRSARPCAENVRSASHDARGERHAVFHAGAMINVDRSP